MLSPPAYGSGPSLDTETDSFIKVVMAGMMDCQQATLPAHDSRARAGGSPGMTST